MGMEETFFFLKVFCLLDYNEGDEVVGQADGGGRRPSRRWRS